MAYDPGALEATLAAVVGEHSPLIADLRAAFFVSADAHVATLKAASEADQWVLAAGRLRSLAASFGLDRLMDAARSAQGKSCGDSKAIERIERALDALRLAPID